MAFLPKWDAIVGLGRDQDVGVEGGDGFEPFDRVRVFVGSEVWNHGWRRSSLKIGRLKSFTSRIEKATLEEDGEARRVRWMKEVTVGPTRLGRVLPIMRAIFLVAVDAMMRGDRLQTCE